MELSAFSSLFMGKDREDVMAGGSATAFTFGNTSWNGWRRSGCGQGREVGIGSVGG
jgi:hypothetical protein